MAGNITDNETRKRYEMVFDGQIVFADYRKEIDIVHILHVETPKALRGTGVTGQFMTALMELMRAQNLKVWPLCSYAAAWMGRNKEYKDLLAQ
jgi:predicted GNAT family acetyltransferase